MRSRTQIEGINLSFSYDGYWGDILAGIGSVDQTGNYVFPVVPAAVYKGGSRMSPYWLAEGGFDAMYTLWNPEPYAQELVVTLKYGANGESYKLPVTLESHASAMIDIGELIRTRQPDQAGDILPQGVKHGSLLVSSPANEPEDAIDVVVGMGIYNPRKATCGGGCITCNGFVSMFMGPGGWVYFPTGDTQQFDCSYNDNYGWQHNVSGWSNWTSSASQVIGVQTAGQSNPGLASAESPGTAEIDAFDPVPLSVYINQMCTNGTPPVCPTSNIGCTGGGAVQVPTSLQAKSATSVGCPGNQNYGIQIDVLYQVRDQNSQPIQVAGMVPYESGTLWSGASYGPSPLGSPTGSDGTFHDVPLGLCSNLPMSSARTATQSISMQVNGQFYPVRSQSWTVSDQPGAAGFGHGTITNGSDVTVSR